jgi:sugar lactone lactonase YvrE
MNQARAKAGLDTLGLLGPHIYPLIGTTYFRDITSGSNATPTSDGKYSATVGYDEATGIGVPLVQALTQTFLGTQTLLTAQVQPPAQTVLPGQSATLTLSVTGTPTGYQWQILPLGGTAWSNLSNSSTFSGALTASLKVTDASTALSGDQFRCLVTYSSQSVTSTESVLIVDTPLVIGTLAGETGVAGEKNGTGTSAEFNSPSGITLDSSGNLYVADAGDNAIRKVTPAGVVTTPYGSLTGAMGLTNGLGNAALFNAPNSIVADSANNLYIADTGNNVVRKITAATGAVTTLASGFNTPYGIAIDKVGNLYVADSGNNIIKKVTSTGAVSRIAGQAGENGAGYADGAALTQALFNDPAGLTVDSSGNIYVADFFNSVVRKITPSGVVSTIAGQPGVAGYKDGPALQALFNAPNALAIDSSGNIYVADSVSFEPADSTLAGGNNLLRKISPAGVVSTVAGQVGISGHANGTGTTAQFYSVQSLVIGASGETYLADTFNQTIRTGGLAPIIVTEPVGQEVLIGDPVSFSTTATGTGPLTYQWRFNGVAISGATGSSYAIASVSSGDAGQYSVTVSSPFGTVTSAAVTLDSLKAQTINFPTIATKTYGVAPFALSATATSGLPVSFSIVSGPATISGHTVTLTAEGVVTVKASVGGNSLYAPATLTQSFTVNSADHAQTITFPTIANQAYSTLPIALKATASSGLPVTYTTSGPVTVSGDTLKITGVGTALVVAHQAGNSVYGAAPEARQVFTISQAAQTITFPAIANQVVGASVTLRATASSGLAIAYSHVGPVTITGTTAKFTGTGSVTIGASQAGNADYAAAKEVRQAITVSVAP